MGKRSFCSSILCVNFTKFQPTVHSLLLTSYSADLFSIFLGKLSIIILCLENAMHMGSEVAPECQAELLDLRKQLMEDFSITPELVKGCETEIAQRCDGGLHKRGMKTL